jgi:hypothetical protein
MTPSINRSNLNYDANVILFYDLYKLNKCLLYSNASPTFVFQ